MRIVYLGSPDFAVLPLQKLAEAGQEIAAVYSQPDRPRGKRGKELLPTPVKAAALALGIPVHTPERINDPAVLAELAAYAPDLIVVVAYGQLLKEGLLNIPRLGCINIHGSLLPAYRGAAPIQRAVIDGCRESGVTIMYLDKGMDSGDMILKKTVPLDADETYGTLHDKLQEAGAELLLEAVSMLEQGSAPREAQDHDKATFAPKISREEELLSWELPAERVHALVRGLDPFPGAYVLHNGKRLKLFGCSLAEGAGAPGMVLAVDKSGITVACGSGAVLLRQVQPEGKGRMEAAAFARGHQIKEGGTL